LHLCEPTVATAAVALRTVPARPQRSQVCISSVAPFLPSQDRSAAQVWVPFLSRDAVGHLSHVIRSGEPMIIHF
jgi:hypothetical protein